MRSLLLFVALIALTCLAAWSVADQPGDKGTKVPQPLAGGEWSQEEASAAPTAYRGCLHNTTYAWVTLTIARPNGATVYHLPPGGHYRLWLYKGEAVFISGDPAVGKITANKDHNVAGETTVTISPNDITFQRGVQECLKHETREEDGKK